MIVVYARHGEDREVTTGVKLCGAILSLPASWTAFTLSATSTMQIFLPNVCRPQPHPSTQRASHEEFVTTKS